MSVLKAFFGYDYRFFYALTLFLHALNGLVLAELALELTGSIRIARLGGVLFVVFQAAHEAVMWIGAINEMLVGLFILLTLLFWVRRRYGFAVASYAVALWSKESAVVVLLLVPLIDLFMQRDAWRQYLRLLLPTAIFVAAFLITASQNFMLKNGIHAVGWHAALVLPTSMHRVLFPWGYAVLILLLLTRIPLPSMRTALLAFALLAAALLPYVFVTHTNHVASRHYYIASAVVTIALAAGILRLQPKPIATVMAASFILMNSAHAWTRNDAEMERRAAPTTALLEILKKRSPGPVRIIGFEYAPASDMAKGAAITLPGWGWDDVDLIPPATPCSDCLILEWDAPHRKYNIRGTTASAAR
jgi:hypothetical protein